MTIIQQLQEISKVIYTKPYDELSDYLQGIRDMINLLNGEEQEHLLSETVKQEIGVL